MRVWWKYVIKTWCPNPQPVMTRVHFFFILHFMTTLIAKTVASGCRQIHVIRKTFRTIFERIFFLYVRKSGENVKNWQIHALLNNVEVAECITFFTECITEQNKEYYFDCDFFLSFNHR